MHAHMQDDPKYETWFPNPHDSLNMHAHAQDDPKSSNMHVHAQGVLSIIPESAWVQSDSESRNEIAVVTFWRRHWQFPIPHRAKQVAADIMVGTRRPEKGQNMDAYKCNKSFKMCRNPRFLDETGCVLNENMMSDLAVMVPDLEIDGQVSKINISKERCNGPGTRILTGGGRK
jgi:hypothetical protein